ncbi:hypothetical protein V499_08337 [Pseudogymnoascus sp. VKM F-103]|uniref:acid phosphatase n=1 Tax=Pseudogymnoascus verrucosus TaxID=342668 RepID=A0A2P2SW97_9PEZI|nr:uncharacterized protein VE01_00742 [Pseudogymnoascus verrucosus]KFY71503.1 hypothetical protein V499_08337 [Pseudogymnoascus sp. VKM F-103]OBU01123.1 hypothetical protein VE01_00742 [Pseudogymnoascus verrucosus]
MFFSAALALAGANVALAASSASRPAESTIEPAATAISALAAAATPVVLTSDVKGKGFDRIVQIWLENTDYALAANDPSMKELAKQAITLTNYHAVTHPSEPNYAAVIGGDHFGMDNDDFLTFPKNVSTVIDLLDTKGISFGTYQEHLPYTGFLGFNYSNQANFANDYVRKHNPLALYESVTANSTRLGTIKSFVDFETELKNKKLPQWSFITPNMTNDGHDTTITYASTWSKTFLTPLLANEYFMNNTLIILSFDEVDTYTTPNKVFTLLLGGAVPKSLHGTTDNTFYNHFSTISSVSANWDLPSLGRWDCGANVLQTVANITGYQNVVVDTEGLYFNSSYPGPMSDDLYDPTWPVPNTDAKCANGLGVLASVKKTWGASKSTYNYTAVYNYDAVSGNNVNGKAVPQGGSVNGTAKSTGTAGAPKATSTGGAAVNAATMVPVLAGFVMAAML